MRLVFLGSGAFAVPSLEALLQRGHDVRALVCQPDRPAGRGRKAQAPPTKAVAAAHGLEVLQPPRVRAPEVQAALRAHQPELLVVVAYGQILPPALLELAPRGALNVHASLLPRYRGAAPIQWALLNGERETGVTTMQLDAGLDTGPLLLARATPIGPAEDAAALHDRLAALGAELLLETLELLAAGRLQPRAQDHAQASLAPLLHKQDGRLDWSQPAVVLDRRVRGLHPWPGAFTCHEGRVLKVLRAAALEQGRWDAPPGEVLAVSAQEVVVACAPGSSLRLLEVQPESRRPMDAGAFARGARLHPGRRLA